MANSPSQEISGSGMSHTCPEEYIHIRIRQNTHGNRAIGKTIRFVKELSLAIRTI